MQISISLSAIPKLPTLHYLFYVATFSLLPFRDCTYSPSEISKRHGSVQQTNGIMQRDNPSSLATEKQLQPCAFSVPWNLLEYQRIGKSLVPYSIKRVEQNLCLEESFLCDEEKRLCHEKYSNGVSYPLTIIGCPKLSQRM